MKGSHFSLLDLTDLIRRFVIQSTFVDLDISNTHQLQAGQWHSNEISQAKNEIFLYA